MKQQVILIGLFVGLLLEVAPCMSKRTGNSQSSETSVDSANYTLAENTDSITADTSSYHEKKGPFLEHDTLFLYRFTYKGNKNYTGIEEAYIEKNRRSEKYQSMLSSMSLNTFYKMDRETNNFIKKLKDKHPQPFPVHSLSDMPIAWLPLCSYKGKYYINELDAMYPYMFTDSLFIDCDMEGPTPSIIHSFKQISPTHYQLLLENPFTDNKIVYDVYIVDTKRKIIVLAQSTEGKEDTSYSLHVAKETAYYFDMIAWNSSEMPSGTGVDFDEIDLEKLIPEL